MNQPNEVFDVAIIGGGIAGAGIARDAALRNLSVILFEKNTFGSGTSSKSSKLIHGGLRYLELAWNAFKRGQILEAWKNFRFVFASLRESILLEKIAPGLVKPIPLVVPIYKDESENPWLIYFGTILYGLLALLAGNRRTVRILASKKAVLKLIPNLNPRNLLGGTMIWDHVTDDKKLVEATMRSAINAGAHTLEHARVKHYSFQDDLYQITVERSGWQHQYFARKLINASGPWVDKVRESAQEKNSDYLVPIAGAHITLSKFTNYSVILRAQDKRVFFVITLEDHARVGTTERLCKDPDRIKVLDEEVEYLLCALERYFPEMKFETKDILSQDAGVRPLAKSKNDAHPHAISREHELRVGASGVIHVLGVKLTDHRRAAEEVVDRIIPELKRFRPEIKTKTLTDRIPL